MPASVIVLITMTVVVAIVAVYRWVVTRTEDDSLHIADSSGPVITNQREMARTLNRVDRLGIGLTVATALYAMALLSIQLYVSLMQRGAV